VLVGQEIHHQLHQTVAMALLLILNKEETAEQAQSAAQILVAVAVGVLMLRRELELMELLPQVVTVVQERHLQLVALQ